MIRDDFAGPGGWEEGLRLLGCNEPVIGVEFDADACATAEKAGHRRVLADVRAVGTSRFSRYLASPPCQTFAQSGDGAGLYHFEHLKAAADRVVQGTPPAAAVAAQGDAEQYGVAQTRKRAVLVAVLGGDAPWPTPTHSRFYPRNPTKLDEGVLPWVTMADALGWTEPRVAVEGGDPTWVMRRPSMTIVGSFHPEVVAAPGYRQAGDPSRQNTPGSALITLAEAGVLQSFPVDYPWTGSEASKWRQVGNAIPPLMAAAILKPLLEIA